MQRSTTVRPDRHSKAGNSVPRLQADTSLALIINGINGKKVQRQNGICITYKSVYRVFSDIMEIVKFSTLCSPMRLLFW